MNFGDELRKITEENKVISSGSEIIDNIKQQCYLLAKQGKSILVIKYDRCDMILEEPLFNFYLKYIKLLKNEGLRAEIDFGDYRNRSSYLQDDWTFIITW